MSNFLYKYIFSRWFTRNADFQKLIAKQIILEQEINKAAQVLKI